MRIELRIRVRIGLRIRVRIRLRIRLRIGLRIRVRMRLRVRVRIGQRIRVRDELRIRVRIILGKRDRLVAPTWCTARHRTREVKASCADCFTIFASELPAPFSSLPEPNLQRITTTN